jgi:hypothetical protein
VFTLRALQLDLDRLAINHSLRQLRLPMVYLRTRDDYAMALPER